MENYKWDNSFDVKVEAMNEQHKILIDLMNELEFNRADDPKCVSLRLNKLYEFAIIHFREEEQLLERTEYPGLSSHQLIHQRLISKLESFKQQIERTGKLNDEFFTFLHMWLKSHIQGIDTKYGSHISGVNARHSS